MPVAAACRLVGGGDTGHLCLIAPVIGVAGARQAGRGALCNGGIGVGVGRDIGDAGECGLGNISAGQQGGEFGVEERVLGTQL
jgi:hypothetical protein